MEVLIIFRIGSNMLSATIRWWQRGALVVEVVGDGLRGKLVRMKIGDCPQPDGCIRISYINIANVAFPPAINGHTHAAGL